MLNFFHNTVTQAIEIVTSHSNVIVVKIVFKIRANNMVKYAVNPDWAVTNVVAMNAYCTHQNAIEFLNAIGDYDQKNVLGKILGTTLVVSKSVKVIVILNNFFF